MARPSPKYSKNDALVALGAAIRRARSSVDVSQEALAVDAELDRSYVGGIERGEHNITLMNIIKIADALETKPSELLAIAGL